MHVVVPAASVRVTASRVPPRRAAPHPAAPDASPPWPPPPAVFRGYAPLRSAPSLARRWRSAWRDPQQVLARRAGGPPRPLCSSSRAARRADYAPSPARWQPPRKHSLPPAFLAPAPRSSRALSAAVRAWSIRQGAGQSEDAVRGCRGRAGRWGGGPGRRLRCYAHMHSQGRLVIRQGTHLYASNSSLCARSSSSSFQRVASPCSRVWASFC